MTTAHYLVTVHLNIDLPLALLQPESADAPTARSRRPMPARAAATAAGVGSASMKKLSCLFVLISQFLDERHNIIFRGQAGAFCFSSHFLLKHLHGIHSRIDNADGVSLDDKSDPITV